MNRSASIRSAGSTATLTHRMPVPSASVRKSSRHAASVATAFNTRKAVEQNQIGLVLDRQISPVDSVQLRAYGGTRQLTQYLAFSGAAPNSAGGVVDLDRGFRGAGATWTPTLINLFVFWLFEIPMAFVLARLLGQGPQGVFWALAIAYSTLAVVSAFVFKRGAWKTARV